LIPSPALAPTGPSTAAGARERDRVRASGALVFRRSGTIHTLSYDYEGQLTQITQGQNTTDFVYDALGRRYSRTAGGTTTVFFYAGN